MSLNENYLLFHRFVEEVMNQGNIGSIEQHFAHDFVGHVHHINHEKEIQLCVLLSSPSSGGVSASVS